MRLTPNPNPSHHAASLYLLSPPILDADFYRQLPYALERCESIYAFQLRLKRADGSWEDESLIKRTAERLLPFLKERGVPFILNDLPRLAVEIGADGVHVGADDMAVSEARALVGADFIVGASAYNEPMRALAAAEAGADYVAFGAFFPTRTKRARARAHLGLLSDPSVKIVKGAIGGIRARHARTLMEAGADFLAVSSAIWEHPEDACQAITDFERSLYKILGCPE